MSVLWSRVLPKPIPGSTAIRRRFDSGGLARRHPARQVVEDFFGCVLVVGIVLHGGRLAPHVHEDQVRTRRRRYLQGPGIAGERRDVVDDPGACCRGRIHDGGAAGVDGDNGARILKSPHHRQDAGQFVGLGYGVGAGPGGFAADVEDGGAGLHHGPSPFQGSGGIECLSAVEKAIRGDVDDAHDTGAVEGQPGEFEGTLPNRQAPP